MYNRLLLVLFCTHFVSATNKIDTLIKSAEIVGFKSVGRTENSGKILDLSPSFDARERWPECTSIPVINDASNCKSSWAFAASESMSDRLCVNSGGILNTILSAEELLSCCTGVLSCGEGCSGGGNPYKAWQYWQKHGLPTGGSFESQFGCKPYSIPPCTSANCTNPFGGTTVAATPTCEKKCRDGYEIALDKDRHYGISIDQLPNSQIEIQSDVMLNGPIETTLEIFDDFLQYTTGIYVHLTGEKLGHLSVRILGWGSYEGVPYWTVANSWGTNWGENGTFRIIRGINECGIEANAISGMPKLS